MPVGGYRRKTCATAGEMTSTAARAANAGDSFAIIAAGRAIQLAHDEELGSRMITVCTTSLQQIGMKYGRNLARTRIRQLMICIRCGL
jgi:hypothetical protein